MEEEKLPPQESPESDADPQSGNREEKATEDEKDAASRFRRLISQTPEQNVWPEDETTAMELTGGWHGRGFGEESSTPEVEEIEESLENSSDDKQEESGLTPPSNILTPPNMGKLPDNINEAATLPPNQIVKQEKKSPPPPPPPLGEIPSIIPPSVDTDGMPIIKESTPPPYKPEINTSNFSILENSEENLTNRTSLDPEPLVEEIKEEKKKIDKKKKRIKNRWVGQGCLIRSMIWGMLIGIIVGFSILTYMVVQYRVIASDLPTVADLQSKASTFETTRILDQQGNLLYEILDPNAGRRTYVDYEKISPFMIAATIATEDEQFFEHPGFNAIAILRAFWQNLLSGETVSGASTITQQLARALLFEPEEARSRSYMRKIREALLAIEITRVYSKEDILELYLNEIYFGNLAYGVEAAAQTYFGSSAEQLTLPQAAFLAGLPQAPSVYDIYSNREATLFRVQNVLRLFLESSIEPECIKTQSSGLQSICITADDALQAYYAIEDTEFHSPDINIVYPHWVNYIRMLLEEQFDPQTIYRSGFTIETTLDPDLQIAAQAVLQKHVFGLAGKNVQSGALIAIDPQTGYILAMVGSADYYKEEIDGQVNMSISPRQPGSSIKPITYLAAFENGWTPATLIWDVKSEFPPSGLPNDPRDPFVPINYDEKDHGPVTVRTALSNSYNISAVKALSFVGIYQEAGMIEMAHRLGITTLQEEYYGLSLSLGGGEVTLLDLTSAYGVLANQGLRVAPVAITKITDHDGNIVFEAASASPELVVSAEHTYLISSILSDNVARTPSFGPNSVLKLPFPAAAKTGTTNDFRDNWTMGYTPELAVGVWVGNPDYTQMTDTTGLSGAAPIWSEFMQIAVPQVTNNQPQNFVKPDGIVERIICAISGTEPSKWCSDQRTEIFELSQLPLSKENDLWKEVILDSWTGKLGSKECGDKLTAKITLNVQEEWAIEWLKNTDSGKKWLIKNDFPEKVIFTPTEECTLADNPARLEIVNLVKDQLITDTQLPIVIIADGGDKFEFVQLAYYKDGKGWVEIAKSKDQFVSPGELVIWDISELPDGPVGLRLFMRGSGTSVWAKFDIKINLLVPTPTPTNTPTPTSTPTQTLTPTPTVTPSPSETLILATETATITPTP